MVIGFCCCACADKIRSNDDMTILYMVILMIETTMDEEHKANSTTVWKMAISYIIVFPQFSTSIDIGHGWQTDRSGRFDSCSAGAPRLRACFTCIAWRRNLPSTNYIILRRIEIRFDIIGPQSSNSSQPNALGL